MGETWSDRRVEAARAWLEGKCPECGHAPLIQRFDVPPSGTGEGDRDSDLCGFECTDCGWADTVDIGAAQQQVDDWEERKLAEEEEEELRAEDKEWEEKRREDEAEEELGELTRGFYRRVISDNPNAAFLPIDALEEHLKSQAVKELGARAPSARNAFGSWQTFAEEVFEARIASLRKQLLITLWATLALLATPLVAWRQADPWLEGEALQLAWHVPLFAVVTLIGSALVAAVAMVVIGFLAASISGLVVIGLGQPGLARSRKAAAWEHLTTEGP